MSLGHGRIDDHLLHPGKPILGEEHMFRPAQADPLGSEVSRRNGVAGDVGVGPHAQSAHLVGPTHERAELPAFLRVDGGHAAQQHLAGRTVEGEEIPFLHRAIADLEVALGLVDAQPGTAGHTALAHAARHHRGVGRHPAGSREDPLRGIHAVDVVRVGLVSHQDHVASRRFHLHRLVRIEHHLTHRGAGRGGQPLGQHGDGGLGIDARVQQLVELARLHPEERLPLRNQSLVDHLDRNADRGLRGALAAARLQHVQHAVLDGELEILHVPIVFLQPAGDLAELRIDLGHLILQLRDRLRRADAGHDVLALGVQQILAVELSGPGGRVARESDAGAGSLPFVAEDHRLHVDGGSEVLGDVVLLAVEDRPVVVPRAKDGVARHVELRPRVLGKVAPGPLANDPLEGSGQSLEVLRREIEVGLDPLLALQPADLVFEFVLGDVEDDVAEHGQKAPVGVPGEAGIAGPLGEAAHRLVTEAEVEDGIHHARHRELGTGADGD